MRTGLSVFLLCCFAPLRAADLATVQLRLNTDYDDSPHSLTLIEAIAKYAPLRVVPVLPGDTLDGVFVREYNFGKSNLPKSYALLKPIILEKNNLSRPEDLRPGNMVIPALPKRTNEDWGRLNLRNYVANKLVYAMEVMTPVSLSANRKGTQPVTAAGIAALPPELAYKVSKSVGEPRPNSPVTVISLQMDPITASYLADSTELPEGTAKMTTFPLPVKLAAGDPCETEPNTHMVLTEPQRNGIRQMLRNGKRSPLLFVLDTGWPSADAYAESVKTLSEVLKEVWDYKFGYPFQASAVPQKLTAANNGHCRCIERALKELRALDDGLDKHVRVLYVPMTREQGADGVLIDLLTTSTLIDLKAKNTAVFTKSIVDATRKDAKNFVTNKNTPFPSLWEGDEVVTDKSVLDAVLALGQVYAERTGTVFFANESWSVTHQSSGRGKYYVGYMTPQYGLVTAATGNDGKMALNDFALRSPSTKDTMAVLNMKDGALDLTSTRMAPGSIDASLAVAYDGYVTDHGFGTSFAAPRVAWFLAAGEVLRDREIALDDWGWQLQEKLKRLRQPLATDYEKLFFDPMRYIGDQTGLVTTGTPVKPERSGHRDSQENTPSRQ